MTRRFVFVPIFGDTTTIMSTQRWVKAPHVKAWGFLSDHPGPNGGTSRRSTRTQRAQRSSWAPFDPVRCRRQAATDVPENSTDLPDEVCVALAKFALLPVSRSNSDD
jgi:hypothetical protein